MFGTARGVMYGLQTVFDAAAKHKRCGGLDQAMLNRLFWTGKLQAVNHPQGEPGAPMNVIGFLPRTDGAAIAHPNAVGNKHPGLMFDGEGWLLDHDRHTISASLHQYDRFQDIERLIHRKSGTWWTKTDRGNRCLWNRITRKPGSLPPPPAPKPK